MARTVLLVEDTDDTRDFMKFLLEMNGVTVIEATNGLEAVQAAQAEDFDLVLMDIAMPVMNGIDATKAIKKLENAASVPIIAVTAFRDKYYEEALDAGVAEIVPKPVDFEDLKPILSRYLSK